MGTNNPIHFMKKLEESFKLNGLQYTLIKRNEYVALYGIGGEYTDKIYHYEVDGSYIYVMISME